MKVGELWRCEDRCWQAPLTPYFVLILAIGEDQMSEAQASLSRRLRVEVPLEIRTVIGVVYGGPMHGCHRFFWTNYTTHDEWYDEYCDQLGDPAFVITRIT